MAHRFYSETPIVDDLLELRDAEARHLAQVMRKQPGEQITVFDGSGFEFISTIIKIDRRSVQLRIEQRQEVDREFSFDLKLAVALPKGDRQTWMVQKLTELGVSELIPLRTDRGVAQPTPKAIERLNRHIIEASKQCERNVLMKISECMSIGQLAKSIDPGSQRYVAHVSADANRELRPSASPVCFAVGPEGGFTDDEFRVFQDHNWNCLQLGHRILRVETAAVAVAAWWGISNCLAE